LRIVGGGVASPHSYPWQVYLTDFTGRLGCAGALINHEWILTGINILKRF
jgi:plasminogen